MPALSDLVLSRHDPDPVATALAASGDKEFMSALHWVVSKTRDTTTEDLPSTLRMLRVLWWLDFYSDKVDYFIFNLERGYAPFVPEAATFAREIGAGRATTLLERIEALFPKGMPRDHDAWIKVQYGTQRLGEAVTQLEAEFSAYTNDLRPALRRWLGANAAEVKRDVAATAPAPAPLSVEDAAKGSTSASPVRPDGAKSSAALDAVLAATDTVPIKAGFAFLSAAVDWVSSVPGRKGLAPDALPEAARMILTLNELVSALHSAGLLYVADWSLGDEFADIRRWVTEIGATTTGTYLDEFAKLFARGKVPTDRDKRSDALKRVVEKKAKKGPDPLDALDEEYREAALLEIPERLREWLALHRARAEREQLHAAAQPEGSSGDDLLLNERNFIASAAIRLARELASAKKGEEKAAAPTIAIGDVVALETKKGYAYLQATHEHAYARALGPVLRLVDALTPAKLEGAELAKHIAGPTRYFTLLALSRWVGASDANGARLSIVGRALPVREDARPFPPFLFDWGKTRDGRVVTGIWQGGERPAGHVIGLLTEAQLEWNVATASANPEGLAEEIESAWTPARELLASYPD